MSGPIGDHGVTIMLARGELDIEADLASDTAPLNGLVAGLLAAVPGVRAMRDATRGGVATILNEIAKARGGGRGRRRERHPGARRGARRVASCSASTRCTSPARAGSWSSSTARRPPTRWPRCARTRSAREAAVIGRVADDPPGIVLLNTAFGGTRIVDLLVGDPLPRIC